MEKIFYILVFLYFIYCQEQMLWYTTEKHYCKKNKGNCENCECWSCNKLNYIKNKGE